MDALTFARFALKNVHKNFRKTVEDVTPEDAHWIPPGVAHPIGSRYAHLVLDEDFQVCTCLQRVLTQYQSNFKGRTGISEEIFPQSLEWARRVKIDLPKLGIYREAVFSATEKYFDELTDADLTRVIDISDLGYGKPTLSVFLSEFVIAHCNTLMGEISTLKGLLGKKGYPF